MTIAAAIRARAGDAHPGIVFEGRTWTWDEVVAASAARATVLSGLRGDGPFHVGVLLENVPEYVFTLFGAALAGAAVVGINPTRRGAELERDIAHTDCAVVITDSVSGVALDGLALPPRYDVDGPAWASLLSAAVPYDGPLPSDDDLLVLMFTSGSTGAPKAVRMSHGRAGRTVTRAAMAFGPGDVLYCSMPLFHGNALLANLFPALASGASVVLRRRFSASAFLGDIQAHRCTYFNYVGRALSYIVATPPQPGEKDNALKWCLGSEASPRDIAAFTERFGCPVIEGYSSSEGGVVIEPGGPAMPAGALGKPSAGQDVAVVSPSGEECAIALFDGGGRLLNPSDAIGEIVGRNCGSKFEGYYANAEADTERVRGDWYWSGDLGYKDADGWFYFAGRGGDWLRVDGENFSSAPVERILSRYPGFAGVAVFPVPDPVTADQVMAAVMVTSPFDPSAFAAFLATQADLGTKWAPRFLRIVEELPVTGSGKVDKGPLRRARWQTTDPVWWRPVGASSYVALVDEDREGLAVAFEANGRASLLS